MTKTIRRVLAVLILTAVTNTFGAGVKADTKLEATRDLICNQDYGEDVLVDLVRSSLPELGLNVVSTLDGFLEMIEDGCGKTISYDPAKLMEVACREIRRHRTAGNTRREIALCARVKELATEIRKGLPGFNRIRTVQVRTWEEQYHALANAARCNERLEELAGLLGVRRDRLEKLYERSCSRVELTSTDFRVNLPLDETRLFQPRRSQPPRVFIFVPQDWYWNSYWERYCRKFSVVCNLTLESGGAGWLGSDDISDLLDDWPKQLDKFLGELGGFDVSLLPPLVEQMRAVAPSAGVDGSQWKGLFVGD